MIAVVVVIKNNNEEIIITVKGWVCVDLAETTVLPAEACVTLHCQ